MIQGCFFLLNPIARAILAKVVGPVLEPSGDSIAATRRPHFIPRRTGTSRRLRCKSSRCPSRLPNTYAGRPNLREQRATWPSTPYASTKNCRCFRQWIALITALQERISRRYKRWSRCATRSSWADSSSPWQLWETSRAKSRTLGGLLARDLDFVSRSMTVPQAVQQASSATW